MKKLNLFLDPVMAEIKMPGKLVIEPVPTYVRLSSRWSFT